MARKQAVARKDSRSKRGRRKGAPEDDGPRDEEFEDEARDDELEDEEPRDDADEEYDDEAEAEADDEPDEDEEGADAEEEVSAFEEEMHELQADFGEDWIVRFSVQGGEAWLTAEKEDGSQHVEAPTADVLREAVELLEEDGGRST